MIAFSVMYPIGSDSKFDLTYYADTHLPMAQRLLEPFGLREVRLFRGLTDGVPPPTYSVIAELIFDNVEALMSALAAHGAEIASDIDNFTNIKPLSQVSEIITK